MLAPLLWGYPSSNVFSKAQGCKFADGPPLIRYHGMNIDRVLSMSRHVHTQTAVMWRVHTHIRVNPGFHKLR